MGKTKEENRRRKRQARRKTRKKNKKPREEKSVIEELSQATAAVLRQQMLQSRNATGTSVLEGIKIMERRGPSKKFTGEDKKIDFEDQLAQFKKAIEKLGYKHGNKATTAEEMLEELLKGKTIEN